MTDNLVPFAVPAPESGQPTDRTDVAGVTRPETPASSIPTDFDLERYRLPQDYAAVGTKKVITTVAVRRPHRQEFIRVHPDLRYQAALLELKDANETYLVVPSVAAELGDEVRPAILFLAATRAGKAFFWPVKLPRDGKLDDWNRSAARAAQEAIDHWVRIASNRDLGSYETFSAAANLGDPRWPELTLEALLAIAFKDRTITSRDHPVVRSLLGEPL
jgi:hypothetical protein